MRMDWALGEEDWFHEGEGRQQLLGPWPGVMILAPSALGSGFRGRMATSVCVPGREAGDAMWLTEGVQGKTLETMMKSTLNTVVK